MRLLGPILLIILFLTSCGEEELVKNEGANFEGKSDMGNPTSFSAKTVVNDSPE